MILLCAALLSLCAAGMAEETPSVHDDSHHTVEREHGQPLAQKTDSMETHTLIASFDLYCEDCGRVIQENVRREEKQEPHAWRIARLEPSCVSSGTEIRVCTVCGAERIEILPQLAHAFADAALLKGRGVGTVNGTGEYAGLVIGEVTAAPTCTETGKGTLLCLTCQTAVRTVTLPAKGHDWEEWTAVPVPEDMICVTEPSEQRKCRICGETETKVTGPAPGHQWREIVKKEATCTEKGEMERECDVCHKTEKMILPALGHSFGPINDFVKHDIGAVMGTGVYDGIFLGGVNKPSTCTESGEGNLVCLRCQKAERSIVIPAGGHEWSEWKQQIVPDDLICVTDVTGIRHCLDCGEEETEVIAPAPGHIWIGISFIEPTCTEPGSAVRKCVVCLIEETIETPALGHCYMWMDVKLPNGVIESQYICTVCGDVAQQRAKSAEQMYYNTTITSFGPMMRDLIGGSVWHRVTPLNLADEGMFTYPLIASNLYTVGTATVINEKGTQVVNYKLNSYKINVHAQTLVFYPDLEALRTGENAVVVEFDQPIELGQYFGDDQLVLMAITLRADYDAMAPGIQDFREDKELIAAMKELID